MSCGACDIGGKGQHDPLCHRSPRAMRERNEECAAWMAGGYTRQTDALERIALALEAIAEALSLEQDV
jgi:hypothetical protein